MKPRPVTQRLRPRHVLPHPELERLREVRLWLASARNIATAQEALAYARRPRQRGA